MQLEARDKRALIGGAVVVTALLAYLLWPSATEQSGVELVAADQRQGAAAPAAAPAPMQVQPPAAVAPPPAAGAPAAAPPAGAVPEGLTLTGVAGSGAIFSFADGSQRFIARGREVAPGVRLQAIRMRDVILASATSNYRLGFGGVATAIAAPAPTIAAPPGGTVPAPRLTVPGAGTNPMGGPLVSPAQQAQLSQQFVAGLEPRRSGSQVTGWTIKPGASIPALSQAGLQPGDVLLSVNGESISDREQVAGLSQQIVNAHRVEFGFERNGQRLTRVIEVNPRR